MVYQTFSPPKNPDSELEITSQPRLLNPTFGEGMPTFAPDGQNVVLKSGTLKFSILISSDYSAIDTFISNGIQTPFYYTLPDETIARLWLVLGRVKRTQPTLYEYEISLQEQVVL